MRILGPSLLCLGLALELGACATPQMPVEYYPTAPLSEHPDSKQLYPVRASAEGGRTDSDRLLDRTGTIWMDGGACQGVHDVELSTGIVAQSSPEHSTSSSNMRLANVRRALDICARALSNRVSDRLDGRGNLATASSTGAIGGIAAAGTPVTTTYYWIALGTLPIFYEDLQSSRMAVVEYFSGYGVAWVSEQSNTLDSAFNTLSTSRVLLQTAITDADGAGREIRTELDKVNAELSRQGARAGNASGPTLTTTKNELERLLAELQRTQGLARSVRNAADTASELRLRLPEWTRGRFEQVRRIALGQQIASRVGPGEAFRTLIAAPFGLVADTLRRTSSTELAPLVVERNIQFQFDSLPKPMGVQGSTVELAPVTVDNAKITDATRANLVAASGVHIQELVEAAQATRRALANLVAADTASPPQVSLPTAK